jgi:phosphate transport system protein
MREKFASQLAELEQRTASELEHAVLTLTEIADAVTAPTEEKLERITAVGRQLKHASRRIDADLVTITACQAPVASDLRLVLALIQLAHHADLIANQFGLISEQLKQVDPAIHDPHRTTDKLASMAMLAGAQLDRAARAFATRDLDLARQLDGDDDAIDKLNRQVFEATLGLQDAADAGEKGLRHVLVARSLERIGDNAVDIAEQAAFLITAELHEFSDASRPRAGSSD